MGDKRYASRSLRVYESKTRIKDQGVWIKRNGGRIGIDDL